ncbi:hypothetical protein NKH18_03750 [Streptomyces sp. M10(2022)]
MTADVLDLLPPGIGSGVRSFYRTVICHVPAVYAGLYAAFSAPEAARGPAVRRWPPSRSGACSIWSPSSGRTSWCPSSTLPPSSPAGSAHAVR